MSLENERRYYAALKTITLYDKPERLRKRCQREYGLDWNEAIEMAYENVLMEARNAIKGRRMPGAKGAGDGI